MNDSVVKTKINMDFRSFWLNKKKNNNNLNMQITIGAWK